MDTPHAPDPLRAIALSPCRRECCLDDLDVCLGCGRTLEEILAWRSLDEERLLVILARSRLRRRAKEQRQPYPAFPPLAGAPDPDQTP